MTNHFAGCVKLEHIKSRYRELAMQHHPDRGGDLRTMQEINAAYQAALKSFDGQTCYTSENKEYRYKYDESKERALMDMIDKLLKLRMVDVEIMLIGTWIWITGNTKPYKDALKELGCRWHGKRGCWYFQCDGYKHRYSNKSLGTLADQYGYKQFENEKPKEIT